MKPDRATHAAFPFGKFKGTSIQWAIEVNLPYCTWCLTLSKVAERHPEFVTALRRAVAEAQLRCAEQEDRTREQAARARTLHAEYDMSDLL